MRINKNHWLFTRPIAHRGLWNDEVVENSLSAYQNAIEHGYPIEIDLYMTTDKKLVSFHDQTLNRMTGVDGYIYQKSYDELSSLNLLGSKEKIPTFDQVLALCEGKTPLLIELKDQPDKDMIKAVVERLKNYKGEFAIQSFNPLYIRQVKKLAPEFIRGILGTECHAKEKSALTRYILKNLSLNFMLKPDFISYSYTGIKMISKKHKGIPLLAWTVTDSKTAKDVLLSADNIIFENFIPNDN